MQRARIYQDGLKVSTYVKRVAKGGKGGIIKAIELLPKYEEAVIPEAKLLDYALDFGKSLDKAKAFGSALGYKDERTATIVEFLGDGDAYLADIDLPGPDWDTVEIKPEDIKFVLD